jgi:hypothetical protein
VNDGTVAGFTSRLSPGSGFPGLVCLVGGGLTDVVDEREVVVIGDRHRIR